MNTAVIYRSMTGHSKKIAKAIAERLNVQALNVKKKPEINDIDLLFVVGGVYSGKSLPDMVEYMKTITADKVKRVVLITSSASNKCGQDEIRKILTNNNIIVEGEEYRCYGNFLFIKFRHPNKNEITEAVKFVENFVKA